MATSEGVAFTVPAKRRKAYLRERYNYNDEPRRLLGRGWFGSVYACDDRWENQRVAIKQQLRLPWAKFEESVHSQLDHPHILKVIDRAVGRFHRYLVTEIGEPLRPDSIDLRHAQEIMYSLLEGIDYLHHRGVFHRDLKLNNLLTCKGALKIFDFGKAGFCLSNTLQRWCGTADVAAACGIFIELLKVCAPERAHAFAKWLRHQPHLTTALVRQHLYYKTEALPEPKAASRAFLPWWVRQTFNFGVCMFPINLRLHFEAPCQIAYPTPTPWSRCTPSPMFGTSLQCRPSEWVNKHFIEARKSSLQIDKDLYLQQFNRDVTPRLTFELAALERLVMQNSRLHLSGNERFAFHIKSNLRGLPTRAYATEYAYHRFIHTVDGCRVLILTPVARESVAGPFNRIVSIAGIELTRDGINQHMRRARGLRTCGDSPIGDSAYRHAHYALQKCIAELLARDGDITLVGHSLGGTLATRWVAEQPSVVQRRLKLVTFGAPRISAQQCETAVLGDTLDQFGDYRSIAIGVSGDWLPHVGASLPRGTFRLAVAPPKPLYFAQAHRAPLLSDAQIDGLAMQITYGVPETSPAALPLWLKRTALKTFARCLPA